MKALAAFVAAAAVFASGVAWACSCRPFADAAEHIAHASAVFRGRAVETVRDDGPYDIGTTTFELVSPLMLPSQWAEFGPPPERIEVRHDFTRDGIQCAIWFEPGAEVLVIARMGQDRRLYTSACDAPRFPENDYRAVLHLAPIETP